MKKSINTQAIVTGIRSKSDRSLGLTIATPELSVQEKAIFLELQGMNCEMTITPIDATGIEEYKIEKDLETKTPGQRQRSIIYVIWQKQNTDEPFSIFYEKMMDKIASGLKQKYLDD